MDNAVLERVKEPPEQPKFIKLPEVVSICCMSKTSIYAAIRQGRFPKPVKLGNRCAVWVKSEVHGWVDSCIASSREATEREKQ